MLDSVLVWFRRDLRVDDHVALAEATRRARKVYCAFIFDREILDELPERTDQRVTFIHDAVAELDAALRRQGGALIVRFGFAREEIPQLAQALGVSAVFSHRDYEPAAKRRDADVSKLLRVDGIDFESFKDQALLDGAEVLTRTGRPFAVFTPYAKAWLARLGEDDIAVHEMLPGRLASGSLTSGIPSLEAMGFVRRALPAGVLPGMSGARAQLDDFRQRIARYSALRDFPAQAGCSSLSVHLRFGTVSTRELARFALSAGARAGEEGAAKWLAELAWRDFYFMILDNFPQVVGEPFHREFSALRWASGEQAERHFAAWCAGRTGYPLVDAGMRQLNETGLMHNRLRMLTASFLVKDLGIDWRRGEAYFAQRLLDFDLSANNGGWQWSASTGCDAQPYFRIFNPVTQSERFDPECRFIRRFVPELANLPDPCIHAPWRMRPLEQSAAGFVLGRDYPRPVVEHDVARQETLARYGMVKRKLFP